MKNIVEQIEVLDTAIFDAIPSATTVEDRRSLLAVQRVTANTYKEYAYLEIGSYLGGSIQPYLLDYRCTTIYSIDPRPLQQPDDRSPGCVWYYEDNSTERMLKLLNEVDQRQIHKVHCFESNASEVDLSKIKNKPCVAFIDGEHTKSSVLSDYLFCKKVIRNDGTILFHDFSIIYPAVYEICKLLRNQRLTHIPLMMEGDVFAIFFDPTKVKSDPFLSSLLQRNKHFLFRYRLKVFKTMLKTMLRTMLPAPLWNQLRVLRMNLFGRR